MNKLVVNQTGGFPMTTRILGEIQKAHSIFNALGALGGELTIISGCVVAGSNVSDGFVYLNGEVFEFRGGSSQTRVVIKEETENLTFGDGISKPVIKTRYVTFGTGVGAIDWVGFKRIDPILQLMNRIDTLEKKSAVFQIGGGMLFWNKPAHQIPAGWQEVVDWRGRMPVGFDALQSEFNVLGKTAGEKVKALTVENMPTHSHSYGDVYYSESTGTVDIPLNKGSGDTDHDNKGFEIQRTTGSIGDGTEFSILNPYKVVLFIEYIS